jgi:hypothetical protein
MKLTNLAVCSALIVTIFSTPVVARRATKSSPEVSAPGIVIEEFYKWYIHSVTHQVDPLKAGNATLKKYVTPRLILKIEKLAKEMASGGYDSDYFLEAQGRYPDSPELEDIWTRNISVSNVAVRGASATAVISFGDNGALARERVSVIQEGGVWKIDNVKAIYPQPKRPATDNHLNHD